MPCDAGRNADEARRAVAADGRPDRGCRPGLHHERFYGPSHWSHRATEDELADLFVADIERRHRRARLRGPDRPPDRRSGPGSSRSPAARAARPTATCRSSEAAAAAHRRTGVPILTHCEAGTGALEQVRAPGRCRRRRRRTSSLSHVDKVVDRGYHRELLATGAFAEYDRRSAGATAPNGTLQLLELAVEDGLARPGRARDGRRAAGLLPVVRRVARPGLAARRVQRPLMDAPDSTRRSGTACS